MVPPGRRRAAEADQRARQMQTARAVAHGACTDRNQANEPTAACRRANRSADARREVREPRSIQASHCNVASAKPGSELLMPRLVQNVVELVGHTPLMAVRSFARPGMAAIWAKMEQA